MTGQRAYEVVFGDLVARTASAEATPSSDHQSRRDRAFGRPELGGNTTSPALSGRASVQNVDEANDRRGDDPNAAEPLEDCLESATDFRHRDLAGHALEVFQPEWPGGEIYVRYRDNE